MAKNSIPFTPKGLAELARIVKGARQSLTYEDFGRSIGLSGVTVWKIEAQKVNSVQLNTIVALASSLEYSVEELIAICAGRKPDTVKPLRQNLTAQELLPLIHNLPSHERRRLRQLDLGSMGNKELVETMKALTDEISRRFNQH